MSLTVGLVAAKPHLQNDAGLLSATSLMNSVTHTGRRLVCGLESSDARSGSLFSYIVNQCDDVQWSELLDEFRDSNIFQTVPFCAIKSPRSSVERFVLRRGTETVAATLVRVVKLPWLGAECAYVRWGPLWSRKQNERDLEVLREAIRSLRSEYAVKRKMWLRLLPIPTSDDDQTFVSLLQQEGFTNVEAARRAGTMLIDLTPPLARLRKGLEQKWRNCLNSAERNKLEIVEGHEDRLFQLFLTPYEEMLSRKGLAKTGDICSFRAIQQVLPERHKMKVFLCFANGEVCAGAIASAVGERGIYHFGATGNKGMRTKPSYLLQWRIVEWLKQMNCTEYDLHGVNRKKSPGVYTFKAGLCGKNGKEVESLGTFDAYGSKQSHFVSRIADVINAQRFRHKEQMGRLRKFFKRLLGRSQKVPVMIAWVSFGCSPQSEGLSILTLLL